MLRSASAADAGETNSSLKRVHLGKFCLHLSNFKDYHKTWLFGNISNTVNLLKFLKFWGCNTLVIPAHHKMGVPNPLTPGVYAHIGG
jgi:hypothetical protein